MARSAQKPSLTVAPIDQSVKAVMKLLQNKQYDAARNQILALRAKHPENAQIMALEGYTLHRLDRVPEAIEAYECAREAGWQTTELLVDLARCFNKAEKPVEALMALELVLKEQPNHSVALSAKGDAHNQLAEPLQARDAYQAALKVDPSNVRLYIKSTNLMSLDDPEVAVNVLTEYIEKTELLPLDEAVALATLGKLCLDKGDDESAFDYYHRANTLMDASLDPIGAEQENELVIRQRFFTPEVFNTLSPFGLPDVPQIVIMGMSRSGKSLLESLFSGVKGVSLTGESNLLFEYSQVHQEAYADPVEWLKQQTPKKVREMAEGYVKKLGTDSIKISTLPDDLWNLGWLGLWLPNVPIIFCVRDLLDLGVTGYFQQYKITTGTRPSYNLHALGKQIACFEKMMDHWAQVLPNPIYLVEYEELVRNPKGVMDNLLSGLGLQQEKTYEDITSENASMVGAVGPIKSVASAMPLTDQFVGFGQRFIDKLQPLVDGYQSISEQFPRKATPMVFSDALPDVLKTDKPNVEDIAEFSWTLPKALTAVDNGGGLLREEKTAELLTSKAVGLVVFDPAGDVIVPAALQQNSQLQCVTQAALGAGQPGTLYACLDAQYNSTIEPLPEAQLLGRLRQSAMVLAKLPINTFALDAIGGLESVDWLVLGAQHNNLEILQHGQRCLSQALAIQVGINFQSVYHQQSSVAELSSWAAQHGFRFYKLVQMQSGSSMLPRADVVYQPESSELEQAAVLLVPDENRLTTMSAVQLMQLAFLLDTVYHIHDFSYSLLQRIDAALAESYLKTRGYFTRKRTGPDMAQLQEVRETLWTGELVTTKKQIAEWLQQYPYDMQLHRLGAEHSSWSGHLYQAVARLETAINLAPDELSTHLTSVEVLLRAGVWWEAYALVLQLLQRQPENSEVCRLYWEALAMHPAADMNRVEQAIQQFVATPYNAHPQLAARQYSVEGQLYAANQQWEQALVAHDRALEVLQPIQGPLYAEAVMRKADSLYLAGKVDQSCELLWQASSVHPFSPYSVQANQKFITRLSEATDPELLKLVPIHAETQRMWAGYRNDKLQVAFGDFGLPYQGFETLKMAGSRPTMHRLQIYGLEKDLPKNARALDIGCNHGFLLVGLAPQLSAGMGFDISQSCVDVGNAVAKHMGYEHIQLSSQPFDEFVCKEKFDLVIACAVHRWIGVPLKEFGQKLLSYCKRGGIVLLESQGMRSTWQKEVDFDAKAATIAQVGFEVIRKGSLCDDGINYREFWVLRRTAK